jgi:cytochrome c
MLAGMRLFQIPVRSAVRAAKSGGIVALLVPALAVVSSAQAQLRGHGGPVRGVAISSDGKRAVSGSFDTSAIVWSLSENTAIQVLRFHESAVNAVSVLPNGRIVTGGEDGKLAVWQPGATQPQQVFSGHTAPVVAVALSPDGKRLFAGHDANSLMIWDVPQVNGPNSQ